MLLDLGHEVGSPGVELGRVGNGGNWKGWMLASPEDIDIEVPAVSELTLAELTAGRNVLLPKRGQVLLTWKNQSGKTMLM